MTLDAISCDRWIKPHGLYYDAPRNRCLFVDLITGLIINYELESKVIYELNITGLETPAFIIPLKDNCNQFIVNNRTTTIKIEWDGISSTAQILDNDVFKVETSSEFIENNYLVGKASPEFIFYGGTYRRQMCGNLPPPTLGSLYSYDNGVRKYFTDLKVTGGMGWSYNGDKLYYVDSCKKNIRCYDFDGKTGEVCKFFCAIFQRKKFKINFILFPNLANERIVFQYPGGFDDSTNPYRSSIVPLGMTTDKKGYIYVALYWGGAVLKINPK